MDFLNISSPTYYNIFRTFFSNAKLEHDEFDDTVIAITSFLMNTSIRLTLEKFGDYLHLPSRGVSTHGDTLITFNQLINYGAFHHTEYHFDASSDSWVKSDHLAENEDKHIESAFKDIPAPEHVPSHEHAPPPASFSQATQPSSEINSVILDVIHSLINNVRGLRDEVPSHKNEVNSKLSTLEM
ncbi:hypothetical protein PVK06_026631 [Gossypium arboreum]|uniref:Uncharacterized protein n=1 Tax=Gossypium arboreum TaxID=29729 RepID=A0ABR0P0P6_GOSAR|nr:hypothetical protein PVK06_026631 [Gossypium arboreum]